MQLTKKCPGCGWEYPIHSTRRTCVFCKTPIPIGFCSKCGKYTDDLINSMCRECHNAYKVECEMRMYKKNLANTGDAFESWLSMVKQVPKSYPTLSQEQWLEACRYFDGCAMCGNELIDTRGFFIHFADGGRYCNWNVIPLCEACANSRKTRTNPFVVMHGRLGYKSVLSTETALEHAHNNPKRLERIIAYLQPKLEEAINDKR